MAKSKKQCSKCKHYFDRSQFRVDVRYADGRAPWCCTCRREYDAAKKREQRRLNTPYAQRVRATKRSAAVLVRKQELRRVPTARAKAMVTSRRYKSANRHKTQARNAVARAVRAGKLIPPTTCPRCGKKPPPSADGRRTIRADHFMGYAKECWLTIQWVCLKCDGELERERGNTTLGARRYEEENDT